MLPDDGGVEVFESGAILLYLAQTYGPVRAPQQLGADLSWVVWANSELDPLCFGKGMRYALDRPRQRFQAAVSFSSVNTQLLNAVSNRSLFMCMQRHPTRPAEPRPRHAGTNPRRGKERAPVRCHVKTADF